MPLLSLDCGRYPVIVQLLHPGGQHGWDCEAQNCPPSRHDYDHEHDGHLHKFGFSRADAGNDPQRADGSKDKADHEHECEIDCARLKHVHS